MEEYTLASELLAEVKRSAKRWFIIAVAELVVILALVGGILWYFSLPVEEAVVTQTMDSTTRSTMIGIGDNNDGDNEADSQLQTEGSQE